MMETEVVQAVRREDGRMDNQIRQLAVESGLLNAADGSARWSQDNTEVLAAVNGPRQVAAYKEGSDRAVIEVVFKPLHEIPGPAEREIEHVIRRTLEAVVLTTLHPRTGITVVVQVTHDDGSLLACAINAAVAALVDAGVAMRGLVSAVCLALTPSLTLLLDPLAAELAEAQAVMTLAVVPRVGGASEAAVEEAVGGKTERETVTCVSQGEMSVDDYFRCMAVGRSSCDRVGAFLQLSLEKYQRGQQMRA